MVAAPLAARLLLRKENDIDTLTLSSSVSVSLYFIASAQSLNIPSILA